MELLAAEQTSTPKTVGDIPARTRIHEQQSRRCIADHAVVLPAGSRMAEAAGGNLNQKRLEELDKQYAEWTTIWKDAKDDDKTFARSRLMAIDEMRDTLTKQVTGMISYGS